MSSKAVSFGDITILEFPITLGENPSVSAGAPIQLGWKPQRVSTRDIELYEYLRRDERRHRRALHMSVPRRAQILLNAGHSIDEIADAVLKVQVIQKQRTDSFKGSGFNDRLQLVLQTTGKIPLNMMRGVLNLGKPKQNTLQARSA